MRTCCVCGSRSTASMFHFPKDLEQCKIWKERCDIRLIDDASRFVVCSKHFTANDYVEPNAKKFGGRLMLKRNRFPTVNVPNPVINAVPSTTSEPTIKMKMVPVPNPVVVIVPSTSFKPAMQTESTASERVDNNPDSNLLPTSSKESNENESQQTQLLNQLNENTEQNDLEIIQNDNMETTNKVSEEENSKCDDCQRALTYSSAFMKHDGSIVCDKCAASLLESSDATIPPTTLEILTCSLCRNFLSCGPVFLSQSEEAICGRCVKPGEILIRNKHYEALAKLFKFPCRFQKFGCGESVPFTENSKDSPHEKGCLYRRETCPMLTNNIQCPWTGKGEDVLKHCREKHSERVVENPCSIMYDLSVSNICTFVLTAFNFLFLLHTKVCLETQKVFHTVQYLTEPDRDICDRLKYKLDVRKGNRLLMKQGCIASRCRFDYSSETFLITDFSTLEKTFSDWNNCIFTVTVVKLPDCSTKCTKCGAVITKFLHRKNDDWFCSNCAPEILKIRIKPL